MSDASLEQRFEAAIRVAHGRVASEVGYRENRFKEMLDTRGWLATAQHLLAGNVTAVSEGFIQMTMKGRLDLIVESIVLEPEWSPLFTSQEFSNARRRLKQYDCV